MSNEGNRTFGFSGMLRELALHTWCAKCCAGDVCGSLGKLHGYDSLFMRNVWVFWHCLAARHW